MEGFRVWDKIEKKMYYDDFMVGTDGELYRLQSYTSFDEDNYVVNMLPASNSRYIVMRCSGKNDCVNLPIYEFDIMEDKEGKLYKVEYTSEKLFCGIGFDEKNCSIESFASCRCIGNIFEK